jgi:hypothetical protein
MVLLEQTASVSSPTHRRTITVVVVALVACLVAGFLAGAVWRASRPVPLSAPVFGANDGLPSTLVAGKEYTAVLTVAVAADWNDPSAPWVGDGDALGVGAALSYPGVESSILCTSGEFAPGTAITLSCPFTAPDVVGPLTVALGWPWLQNDRGTGGIPDVPGPTVRTYEHQIAR